MKSVKKIENMTATLAAPPAKAYTLRALVLASLAEGTSRISNPLMGEDQINLIACLETLGTTVTKEGKDLLITGQGGKYHPNKTELNAGESGVTMNFLSSLTALCDKEIILTGKEGLLRRPIGEVISGIHQLGGKGVYLDKEGFPPIKIIPSQLKGGTTTMSGSKTSQYFSSLVIAGALTDQETTIICSDEMSEKPYFDITTGMMEMFGVKVNNDNYKKMTIPAGQKYMATDLLVEGDHSSAAFYFQAGAICQSQITVTGLNRESAQGDRAYISLMEEMGCQIEWDERGVTLTGAPLKAITADMTDIPDLVPALAVTAAFAEGTTTLTGVGRLRFKECDRLEAVKTNLEAMGGKISYDEDNLYITGSPLRGAQIDPYGDHRIAMAFGIAGLAVGGQTIENPTCVAKSFPDFWERIKHLYKS